MTGIIFLLVNYCNNLVIESRDWRENTAQSANYVFVRLAPNSRRWTSSQTWNLVYHFSRRQYRSSLSSRRGLCELSFRGKWWKGSSYLWGDPWGTLLRHTPTNPENRYAARIVVYWLPLNILDCIMNNLLLDGLNNASSTHMCSEVVIGPAGSRAMVRAWANAKMGMHVHYLHLNYVRPARPISTSHLQIL